MEFAITSVSFDNHLPEDGHRRPKHVGVPYIYKLFFLLLCNCLNKYFEWVMCTFWTHTIFRLFFVGDHSFLRVNNDKIKNGFIGHFNGVFYHYVIPLI